MGFQASGIIADLAFARLFEDRVLPGFCDRLKIYLRVKDDIFIISPDVCFAVDLQLVVKNLEVATGFIIDEWQFAIHTVDFLDVTRSKDMSTSRLSFRTH